MALAPLNGELLKRMVTYRQFDELHKACDNYIADSGATENDKKVAYHLKGMAFYLQNNLAKSIDCFIKVLSMDPKFTDSAVS